MYIFSVSMIKFGDIFVTLHMPCCLSGCDAQNCSGRARATKYIMHGIDIKEDELLAMGNGILETLLFDRTTGENIIWATDDYAALGEGYLFHDHIQVGQITGKNQMVIRPRVLKTKDRQTVRSKGMAEVFTPSWICNVQNNLADEPWLGKKRAFNVESENGRSWQAVPGKVEFTNNKTWQDYVHSTRLEITCGEAPYLVSRYDTTTGRFIPLEQRIGLLDRKLRIVGENTETKESWLYWSQIAYKNIYGYEWQGDNLLLAREALLLSFIEYYQAKFSGEMPSYENIRDIASVISWNLWQMDGLKAVVPDSCHNGVRKETDIFGNVKEIEEKCPGCKKKLGNLLGHNGIYCLLADWKDDDDPSGENTAKVRYVDLIGKNNGRH